MVMAPDDVKLGGPDRMEMIVEMGEMERPKQVGGGADGDEGLNSTQPPKRKNS